jgi:hypothetical protein
MMRLSRSQIIWAACIGLVGLAGYFSLLPDYTNRFRLTIEVETPDGIKSGSSVIETTFWESGNWGPVEARGVRSKAKGQAVFVDLGNGRNLVAILGFGPNGTDESKIFGLTRAALAPGRDVGWKEEYKLKGRGMLPADYLPALITFPNLNDPATAILVYSDDLKAVFGSGYAFHQAIIETTNEPLNRDIGKRLPWWSLPDRPAGAARRAWSKGSTAGASLASEDLFQKE